MKSLLVFLILYPALSSASLIRGSRCVSVTEDPFKTKAHFEFEDFEIRKIGILDYLAGGHKRILQTAQAGLRTEASEATGCLKSTSLVLFMEPSKYSDKPCPTEGITIHDEAKLNLKLAGSRNEAFKLGTQWFTNIVSDHYPECPSDCSFASTTKFKLTKEDLVVQTSLKCVQKRAKKENYVHAGFLHEWTCND